MPVPTPYLDGLLVYPQRRLPRAKGRVWAPSPRAALDVAVCFDNSSPLPALFLLRATNCYLLHSKGQIPNSSSLMPVCTSWPFRTKGNPIHCDIIHEPMRPSNGD